MLLAMVTEHLAMVMEYLTMLGGMVMEYLAMVMEYLAMPGAMVMEYLTMLGGMVMEHLAMPGGSGKLPNTLRKEVYRCHLYAPRSGSTRGSTGAGSTRGIREYACRAEARGGHAILHVPSSTAVPDTRHETRAAGWCPGEMSNVHCASETETSVLHWR